MSFASQTRAELCRIQPADPCCSLAEAYGVLLFCSHFSAQGVRIVTESVEFARRLPVLFHDSFHLAFDRQPEELTEGGKFVFSIGDRRKLAVLFNAFGQDMDETLAHHINFAVLEEDCCRDAFFRGAFLAGGSVTDPAKRYHMELATSHYSVSRELSALLLDAGFAPKETTRKSNYITYFKQSTAIERLLAVMGAPEASAQLRSARAEKAVMGSVNRRVNCDAANLDKMVDAAQEQIEAIRRLRASGVMDTLPHKLQVTAELREENPELTLSQLAALCDPPVTKSALNHRLRRLLSLSRGGAEAVIS